MIFFAKIIGFPQNSSSFLEFTGKIIKNVFFSTKNWPFVPNNSPWINSDDSFVTVPTGQHKTFLDFSIKNSPGNSFMKFSRLQKYINYILFVVFSIDFRKKYPGNSFLWKCLYPFFLDWSTQRRAHARR